MLFLLLKSLFNHLKKLILRITFDFFEYLKPQQSESNSTSLSNNIFISE